MKNKVVLKLLSCFLILSLELQTVAFVGDSDSKLSAMALAPVTQCVEPAPGEQATSWRDFLFHLPTWQGTFLASSILMAVAWNPTFQANKWWFLIPFLTGEGPGIFRWLYSFFEDRPLEEKKSKWEWLGLAALGALWISSSIHFTLLVMDALSNELFVSDPLVSIPWIALDPYSILTFFLTLLILRRLFLFVGGIVNFAAFAVQRCRHWRAHDDEEKPLLNSPSRRHTASLISLFLSILFYGHFVLFCTVNFTNPVLAGLPIPYHAELIQTQKNWIAYAETVYAKQTIPEKIKYLEHILDSDDPVDAEKNLKHYREVSKVAEELGRTRVSAVFPLAERLLHSRHHNHWTIGQTLLTSAQNDPRSLPILLKIMEDLIDKKIPEGPSDEARQAQWVKDWLAGLNSPEAAAIAKKLIRSPHWFKRQCGMTILSRTSAPELIPFYIESIRKKIPLSPDAGGTDCGPFFAALFKAYPDCPPEVKREIVEFLRECVAGKYEHVTKVIGHSRLPMGFPKELYMPPNETGAELLYHAPCWFYVHEPHFQMGLLGTAEGSRTDYLKMFEGIIRYGVHHEKEERTKWFIERLAEDNGPEVPAILTRLSQDPSLSEPIRAMCAANLGKGKFKISSAPAPARNTPQPPLPLVILVAAIGLFTATSQAREVKRLASRKKKEPQPAPAPDSLLDPRTPLGPLETYLKQHPMKLISQEGGTEVFFCGDLVVKVFYEDWRTQNRKAGSTLAKKLVKFWRPLKAYGLSGGLKLEIGLRALGIARRLATKLRLAERLKLNFLAVEKPYVPLLGYELAQQIKIATGRDMGTPFRLVPLSAVPVPGDLSNVRPLVVIQRKFSPNELLLEKLKKIYADKTETEETKLAAMKALLQKVIDYNLMLWEHGLFDSDFHSFTINYLLPGAGAGARMESFDFDKVGEDNFARLHLQEYRESFRLIHLLLNQGWSAKQILRTHDLHARFQERTMWGRMLLYDLTMNFSDRTSDELARFFFDSMVKEFQEGRFEQRWKSTFAPSLPAEASL